MIYLLVKSAHIFMVLLWVGSSIWLAFLLRQVTLLPNQLGHKVAQKIGPMITLNSVVMVGTWSFGIVLLVMGQWIHSAWMVAKLALVVVLSGLHGAMAGQWRRLRSSPEVLPTKAGLAVILYAQIFLVAGVVFLVVVKP